jgi:hypothetical protein
MGEYQTPAYNIVPRRRRRRGPFLLARQKKNSQRESCIRTWKHLSVKGSRPKFSFSGPASFGLVHLLLQPKQKSSRVAGWASSYCQTFVNWTHRPLQRAASPSDGAHVINERKNRKKVTRYLTVSPLAPTYSDQHVIKSLRNKIKTRDISISPQRTNNPSVFSLFLSWKDKNGRQIEKRNPEAFFFFFWFCVFCGKQLSTLSSPSCSTL